MRFCVLYLMAVSRNSVSWAKRTFGDCSQTPVGSRLQSRWESSGDRKTNLNPPQTENQRIKRVVNHAYRTFLFYACVQWRREGCEMVRSHRAAAATCRGGILTRLSNFFQHCMSENAFISSYLLSQQIRPAAHDPLSADIITSKWRPTLSTLTAVRQWRVLAGSQWVIGLYSCMAMA